MLGITPDPYRAFVFPNRVRDQRQRKGLQKLMALSERIPEIPYIRLSKIERGEIFARPDELVRIAGALAIAPVDLLIDVDAAAFDIAAWAVPFQAVRSAKIAEERNAVLLAAALRLRRNQDRTLTIAVLDRDYGLPAVILSRLGNAQKTLDRWNEATVSAIYRLFGVDTGTMLQEKITAQFLRGDLDGYIEAITDPEVRMLRTRQRVAELRASLLDTAPDAAGKPTSRTPSSPAPAVTENTVAAETRMLRVIGTPLPNGLIGDAATDAVVEAPARAGPRAFGVRVCRATLGPGLPANAIVIVDPDRVPVVGGVAAIRTGEGYRLVTVTFDRNGTTMGYSVSPDVEVNIDELDPADVASVISAVFP